MVKRATVQITFLYDRSECSRPDKWDWTELLEQPIEKLVLLSDEPAPDAKE